MKEEDSLSLYLDLLFYVCMSLNPSERLNGNVHPVPVPLLYSGHI